MAWGANRNTSTTCHEQICPASGVGLKIHWVSHVGRELRLRLDNGEVENHPGNFLIQSCRQHLYWTRNNSPLGLLCNSPFQAPPPGWTETAQQARRNQEKQAKRPPCFKIFQANRVRNENIQTVKEEASFNWSKSFKQKDFYFFRKWKHFQKHREHHLPFLPSSPTVIETKAQKQIFPTEKDLLPLQRELCTGSSSNSRNHCLPTRKMMIIMNRNPNTHKKSNTPRANNWYRQGSQGSKTLFTNKRSSGLWTTLGAPGPGHTIYGLSPPGWRTPGHDRELTCPPGSPTWKNKITTKIEDRGLIQVADL